MRSLRLAGLVLSFGILFGCPKQNGSSTEGPGSPGSDPSAPSLAIAPLRPHEFKQVETPTKKTGEDCTVEGASVCNSGICVHVSVDPEQGYVCTTTCVTRADCVSGWACLQAHPDQQVGLCLPPKA